APPYRQADACPSSWKPAEATASANTRSSSPGLSNASAVAEATPLWKRTNQNTAAKPARAGHMIQGENRNVNGAVSRRVRTGSVTRTFQRSASKQALRGQLVGQRVDVLLVEAPAEPLGHRGGQAGALA